MTTLLPDGAVGLEDADLDVLRRRRSAKWSVYGPEVIPAWVAEMDFPIAEPIRARLREAIEAGDLGYPSADRCGVREAFAAWVERAQGWTLDPEAVIVLPDCVRGIELALVAHTEPGDAVVVPTPVYPPFLSVVRDNGRRLVEVELARERDSFAPDLDAVARALAAGARVVLLCHPHNPTGHVHERGQLVALAELAEAHGAIVVSDEIHAPLTLDGRPHTPFATVSEQAAACSVTVTSASKAWNMPGLRTAFLVAEAEPRRAAILGLGPRSRGGSSILGLEATIAAFERGQPWLDAVRAVLERNRATVLERVAATLPGVELPTPRATYLAWLDCRRLELEPSPFEFFLEHARVALSDGANFGLGGEGHVRLNFGTTGAVLGEILDRMAAAVRDRG